MNHISNTWVEKTIFCQKQTNNFKAKSSEETPRCMCPMRQICYKKKNLDKVHHEQQIKRHTSDDDYLLLCYMLIITTATHFTHRINSLRLFIYIFIYLFIHTNLARGVAHDTDTRKQPHTSLVANSKS